MSSPALCARSLQRLRIHSDPLSLLFARRIVWSHRRPSASACAPYPPNSPMLTDWWSAEGFEFSEAKPLPVNQMCAGRVPNPLVQCNHLCIQTVRWNGSAPAIAKRPLCFRIP